MTTAVGFSAAATCAAIRGGIAGFRETRFMVLGGTYLLGAEVPLPGRIRGVERLAHLVAQPIGECLAADASPRTDAIPLLLGVAEPSRPGRVANLDSDLFPFVERLLGRHFHRTSKVIPMGRVSGGVAVNEAITLIREHGFHRVVVAGVDGYLTADTIESFDDASRLLTEQNSNGFIPGEAGSALLLGPAGDGPGLQVRAVGFAVEKATIESDNPLRGEGLTAAYREALSHAGLGLHDIDYRIADVSGEQYGFKEAMYALARTTRVRKEFQDLWCPADCLGETGAAVTPCMASVAWWAARKNYAPGPLSLLHAGNDDGRRMVMVVDGTSFRPAS
jgi:3-oxoacyl-[acyl-carrier-protein] synthase-1